MITLSKYAHERGWEEGEVVNEDWYVKLDDGTEIAVLGVKFSSLINSGLDHLQLYELNGNPVQEITKFIIPGSELDEDAPITAPYLHKWLERFQPGKKASLGGSTFKEAVYLEGLDMNYYNSDLFNISQEFNKSIVKGLTIYYDLVSRYSTTWKFNDKLYFIREGRKVYVTKKDLLDLHERSTGSEMSPTAEVKKSWLSKLLSDLF